MISTVNSLKDLYVKLGGSLTDTYEGIANGVPVADYNVIPDMIEAVTQKAGSGGGGGGSFLVTIAWDETASKYVSDKTYAEIKAAFESGQSVVAFSDPTIYELAQVDSGFIRFASNDFDFASSTNTLGLTSKSFKILSDDSVTEDYFNVKWTVTNNG
jgi:hypothetical protein